LRVRRGCERQLRVACRKRDMLCDMACLLSASSGLAISRPGTALDRISPSFKDRFTSCQLRICGRS
jgi:hypothetical protein